MSNHPKSMQRLLGGAFLGTLLVPAACGPTEEVGAPRALTQPASPGAALSARPAWLPPDAPLDPAHPVFERAAASLDLPDADVDLDDTRAVFAHVFASLPARVDVLPTENYLYWRFRTADKYVWGNVRLGPGSRDEGKIHLGYYEFREDLHGPKDANARYTVLDGSDGVAIEKIDDFEYVVYHDGRSVEFALNRVDQGPPRAFALDRDEAFVFRMHDESNVRFHLLFNLRTQNFSFVVDEDDAPLDHTVRVGDDLVLDQGTGFLFFEDAKHGGRKILVGSLRRNVAQNNYFDGPADQLADNYIKDVPAYKGYLNAAYPFTRGVIDDYGVYVHDPGSRVAVAPYHLYGSIEEMKSMLQVCRPRGDVADMMACLMPGGVRSGAEKGRWFLPALPAARLVPASLDPAALAPKTPLSSSVQTVSSQEDVAEEAVDAQDPDAIHAQGITWHIKGGTFVPPDAVHAQGITWHVKGGTFVPPDAVHAQGITWHVAGGTFVPPDAVHAQGITWHIADGTFVPPDAVHAQGITWHVKGGTFVPPDAVHAQGITWHIADGTFVPPDAVHAQGITWHIADGTFVPPDAIHAQGITWHIADGTFVPPDAVHAQGITWHVKGGTFVPPDAIHAQGITWHIAGGTFVPPDATHAQGITWHVKGGTFVPPDAVHAQGITWHIAGGTFIPVDAEPAPVDVGKEIGEVPKDLVCKDPTQL